MEAKMYVRCGACGWAIVAPAGIPDPASHAEWAAKAADEHAKWPHPPNPDGKPVVVELKMTWEKGA